MRIAAFPTAFLLFARGASANPNQFEAVSPGGETKCFHGGDFHFMHRKGTVNKLVVEFEGGGGCWNAETCGAGTCTESVDRDGELRMLNGGNSGIHDGTNKKNAFAEWHHVFIPYCTCDAHTGINDKRYTVRTVHHRGHINFMSAMNWTLANFPTDPDAVAITGCSAGSVGVLTNWPFVADMYPKAQHYVFGDSYIGLFASMQYNDGYRNWKLQYNTRLPGYAPDKVSKYFDNMACYVQQVANDAYPRAQLGWYTSDADKVQTAFYTLGGGLGWTRNMRELVGCYQRNLTAVHTFIAQGDHHCRSQNDGYYAVTSDGTNLAQWVDDIVTGESARRDVDCADPQQKGKKCRGTPVGTAPLDLNGYASRIPYRNATVSA